MRGWGGQVHAPLQCNLAHTAGLLDARLGRRACEEGVGVGVQGCSMLDYSVLHHAVHNRQLGVVKVPPIESGGGGFCGVVRVPPIDPPTPTAALGPGGAASARWPPLAAAARAAAAAQAAHMGPSSGARAGSRHVQLLKCLSQVPSVKCLQSSGCSQVFVPTPERPLGRDAQSPCFGFEGAHQVRRAQRSPQAPWERPVSASRQRFLPLGKGFCL